MAKKIVCEKCGRTRSENEFFKIRGERDTMCKDCLCQYIDVTDEDTFLWILERSDFPYIKSQWVKQVNKCYSEKGKVIPKIIMGTYMRTMNMVQFKKYSYADSDRLNFADSKANQEANAKKSQESEEELRQRLENGEITEAEYKTFSKSLPAPVTNDFLAGVTAQEEPISNPLLDQLTPEDYQHLQMRWGSVYRPDQWLTMETMYNKYASEYEINVDREEVLKKMCKTSLKMDECLDAGDVTAYKNLAGVFDQLRKSGKFTEVQNKEEKQTYLDTIGELVRLVEEAKGPIQNILPDPDEYPQDKIDKEIMDMKAYTYNLVAGEPHLQDMIEAFIEKYEKAEEAEKNLEDNLIISDEQLAADALTDKEAEEYQGFLEKEIEADAAALLADLSE